MAPPWGRVDERSLSREGVLCHVAQKQWGPSLSLWLNQWPTFVKHHIFVPRISSSSTSSSAVLHGHGSQGNPNNKEQFEASAVDTVFKAHKRAEGTALHRMEMQRDASVLA
ncbi:unnamed protein product [Prunus armeniaca]|uniref:Uncharacterized protein n=1 Tax=Prunus armeniaca TaxID=36596 RepID=A0A6J5YES1_PRUAR|nr:unnamed protein product [Prunus armeniaca]CAB4322048.1 unnamed protein product [Prunus armeniaca]